MNEDLNIPVEVPQVDVSTNATIEVPAPSSIDSTVNIEFYKEHFLVLITIVGFISGLLIVNLFSRGMRS